MPFNFFISKKSKKTKIKFTLPFEKAFALLKKKLPTRITELWCCGRRGGQAGGQTVLACREERNIGERQQNGIDTDRCARAALSQAQVWRRTKGARTCYGDIWTYGDLRN
jgi:hypothetical protein